MTDQPALPGMPPAPPPLEPTRLEFGVVFVDDGLPVGFLAKCAKCGDQMASDDKGRASAWAIDHDADHAGPGPATSPAKVTT